MKVADSNTHTVYYPLSFICRFCYATVTIHEPETTIIRQKRQIGGMRTIFQWQLYRQQYPTPCQSHWKDAMESKLLTARKWFQKLRINFYSMYNHIPCNICHMLIPKISDKNCNKCLKKEMHYPQAQPVSESIVTS